MDLEATLRLLKSGKKLHIVALGDSLTYGWMVQKGYIDFFSELLTRKYPGSRFVITNKGVPGDTAAGGLQRLQRDVLDLQPDLVFVQFALNDAFCGVSPEQFQSSVTGIIDRIRRHTAAEILLMSSVALPASENRIVAGHYDALARIAETEQVAVARVHEYWQQKAAEGPLPAPPVQADGVHPTEYGYRLMAEAVMLCF